MSTLRSPDIAMMETAGYALLPGFVGPGELGALRRAVEYAVAETTGTSCARPNNLLVPLRWPDPCVELVLGSAGRVARLRHVLRSGDLRWISGYVSVKEPASGPLWWHQDWWCWDHQVSFERRASQVALLCYLSDTDSANGALRVIPGSHLRSTTLHSILPAAHRQEPEALGPGHLALSDAAGQVTCGLRAGDAVVMDYRLLHGTHANESEHRRTAVLLTFTPDWTGLPPEIRGHLAQHPSLPSAHEAPGRGAVAGLLPEFDGQLASLELNRDAPERFTIT